MSSRRGSGAWTSGIIADGSGTDGVGDGAGDAGLELDYGCVVASEDGGKQERIRRCSPCPPIYEPAGWRTQFICSFLLNIVWFCEGCPIIVTNVRDRRRVGSGVPGAWGHDFKFQIFLHAH